MKDILQTLRDILPPTCHDKVFIVGGLVRDHLLGPLTGKPDIDLVARLPKDDILRLGTTLVRSKSAAPVFILKHERFGTNIQIAQPRTEKKTGLGHNGFQHHADHTLPLEKDLERRDFTVNAIAMTLDGEIIDPFGGRRHLNEMKLHHISEAFKEDPDRVFRGFRFCAQGFNFSRRTRDYISSLDLTKDFAELPANRVFMELEKALKAEFPHRFFEEMLLTGQGREFFPEVFLMQKVPAGPPEHHPEGDLFSHSINVLKEVATMTDSPVTRCAAFFHDVGKLLTPAEELPRHIDHEKRGEELSKNMFRRLNAPGSYIHVTALINKLHMKAARFPEMRTSSKLRFAKEAMLAFHALPLVVKADAGIVMENFEEYVSIANLPARKLGVDIEKLRSMTSPADISSIIMQKRVEMAKAISC